MIGAVLGSLKGLPHLPRPLRSLFNSDHLAAEPRHKLQRVILFSEISALDVLAIAHKHVATLAEG